MLGLDLYSEPFAPTGSTAAKGVREALGRPELDTLVVLVREAVQNSWDARLSNSSAIEFSMDGVTIETDRLARWRQTLGFEPVEGLELDAVLSKERLDLLFISDRGTTGLVGPTRSDKVGPNEQSDFVDFVRNVGQPRDTHLGGGTYGYGKSVFYVVSKASTVVIYTRVQTAAGLESRLIASALGQGFTRGEMPYTGRHWWGTTESGVVEPILGKDADDVATYLGFPSFAPSQTGTTVAIVGFEGLDSDGAPQPLGASSNVLAEAIAWYCWPKFDVPGQMDQVAFSVSCDGSLVEVPGPSEIPCLALFRRSLAAVLDEKRHPTDHTADVRAQRPKRLLGRVALTTGLTESPSYVPAVAPISEPVHHVALMRHPRLIVKYQPGNPLPNSTMQWAGAFITDDDVDDAFADAEPPTHDDWVKERLPKQERRLVSIAYTRIREIVDEFFRVGQFLPRPSEATSLGALSHRLGSLIASSVGTGARSQPGTPSSTRPGGIPRGSVAVIAGPDVVELNGRRAMRLGIDTRPIGPSLLVIVPKVIVDGGRPESDAPTGAATPELLSCWLGGVDMSQEPRVDSDTKGEVWISVPDDTMVAVSMHLEVVDAE